MKKIMLAIDGSKNSLDAAKFLAHLPHDEQIEVAVVSILHVRGGNRPYLVGDWVKDCLQEDREKVEQAFESVQALFEGAQVSLNHIIKEGPPAETLVKVAKNISAELVVLGAKGHSGIARLLLGSTSDYVATHAPCSVFVVRPTDVLSAEHPLRIAIGYEPTGPAQAALEEFREIAWGSTADVRLLCVSMIPGIFEQPYREPLLRAVQQAAADLHDLAPNAKAEWLEHDYVGEGLVKYIDEHAIDIVFLGESPHTELGRILMGSVTRFVLRHASCSVWITRNRTIRGFDKGDAIQASAQPAQPNTTFI